MNHSREKAEQIADHLDEVLPPEQTPTALHDDNPAVAAALRLANAPEVALDDQRKAAILEQALATYEPANGKLVRLRQWTVAQQLVAAVVGLVVMALLILYVFAPAVNTIRSAARNQQDTVPEMLPITPLAVTEIPVPTTATPVTPLEIEVREPLDNQDAEQSIVEPPDGGRPGDFGCERPGNYCNAPGQTNKNDN